ncbi:MAG TPA: nuclear transport factor 2 family protein, partial [Acidimicrobiales bacterium]|nr:nuclear transport factor 2 family protein [Acidimicrobiales bacterium]
MTTTGPPREVMRAVIETYFDGCNEADATKITACFTEDAVHYFPEGAAFGTFVGADAIAAGWRRAVEALGS